MAEHHVILDDEKDRSLMLNTELSTDERFSVKVVYERSSSGNWINFLVIRSLADPKLFDDHKIAADGVKIPPDVPGFR
jgi:hypothetical protein